MNWVGGASQVTGTLTLIFLFTRSYNIFSERIRFNFIYPQVSRKIIIESGKLITFIVYFIARPRID